jgi:hypothetical protein
MNKRILNKLQQLEIELKKVHRISLKPHPGWNNDVPRHGGVYVIWEKKSKKPVYIGETCHLKHRFSDLRHSVNHTFRRQIAKRLKLEYLSDSTLSERLSKIYSISYLTINFGRKELEEYLILRWRKSLINKPQKRLLQNNEYTKLYK